MKTQLYVQQSLYRETRKRVDVQYENSELYKQACQKKKEKKK